MDISCMDWMAMTVVQNEGSSVGLMTVIAPSGGVAVGHMGLGSGPKESVSQTLFTRCSPTDGRRNVTLWRAALRTTR
jgi:hypothetical protein